jgi:hypothetical protein
MVVEVLRSTVDRFLLDLRREELRKSRVVDAIHMEVWFDSPLPFEKGW